jgi:hypothetical protein
LNVVHASVHSVASAVAMVDAHSANDSLSHRSFHHFMVTRSPNHMCASSCRIVTTRRFDGVGHLAAEDVGLGEGHRAGVLHRARVELRDEELVVLRERVRDAELLLVVGEALAGLVEDVVGVEVLPEALAAVDAERDDAPEALVSSRRSPRRGRRRSR